MRLFLVEKENATYSSRGDGGLSCQVGSSVTGSWIQYKKFNEFKYTLTTK
jgi:hypothetical protein